MAVVQIGWINVSQSASLRVWEWFEVMLTQLCIGMGVMRPGVWRSYVRSLTLTLFYHPASKTIVTHISFGNNLPPMHMQYQRYKTIEKMWERDSILKQTVYAVYISG